MKDGKVTIDKPKFEVPPTQKFLGAVDLKIDQAGARLAVSTLDYGLRFFDVSGDDSIKELGEGVQDLENGLDIQQFTMSPSGEEIIGGTSSVKVCEFQSGRVVREFN